RLANGSGFTGLARGLLVIGLIAAAGCGLALVAGPWTTGLDPTLHAYPAIVWALVVWVVVHLAVGMIMQAYCLARSIFGLMTPKYDADIWNVSLCWHFVGFSVLLTAAIIGGFPLLQ